MPEPIQAKSPEEIVSSFLEHPALLEAQASMVLQAVRAGTTGDAGPYMDEAWLRESMASLLVYAAQVTAPKLGENSSCHLIVRRYHDNLVELANSLTKKE